ncbi:MAG: aspartate/glutamate racemase family protein [Candidatus Competibacterales bacterium]|nr:aspartate/glutamate racemase family protein [Candidatus Competibacterales bacterium]
MQKRTLIGMLTPSSNTVLEPLTSLMLADLYPEVTAHFGRFRVREIALDEQALGQFDETPILEAARLLADARLDVLCWNGTSAGWLGFETDERLCETLTADTGIPATSSVLALNELLGRQGVTRLGLVTPYLDEVQARIVANYAGLGIDCVAERHLGDRGNFSFSDYEEATIESLIREVAAARPEAITTFCTNLRAAPVAARLEAELDIPIYDTVTVALWKALTLTGVDPARVRGWGRMFTDS